MTPELVYLGRDNAIVLRLEDNNSGVMAPSDLSAVTKLEVLLNGDPLGDSVLDANCISFTPTGTVTLKLGTLISERGEYVAQLVLYSATNTNGVVWQPDLRLTAV